jgi:hypothetical protein
MARPAAMRNFRLTARPADSPPDWSGVRMRTGTWRDRGIACGVVLAWHFAGWWLLHAVRGVPDAHTPAALQVVYFSLPQLPRTPPAHARRRPSAHASGGRQAPLQALDLTDSAPRATEETAVTQPAAALAGQIAGAARAVAGAPLPAPDPFASRPVRLPGRDASRFRMRPALSPADMVVAVSRRLFYPPGYEADPCPRNQRNLHNLLAAGDSQRLRMAMAFDREHCRP